MTLFITGYDAAWSTQPRKYELKDIAANKIKPEPYDYSGVAEEAMGTANTCAEFIGVIMQKLYEKGIFTDSKIEEMFYCKKVEEK